MLPKIIILDDMSIKNCSKLLDIGISNIVLKPIDIDFLLKKIKLFK